MPTITATHQAAKQTSGLQLLLSDARGVYIPRDFVTGFDMAKWSGISADDIATCENPDHEWYWESWDSILSGAKHTDPDGNVWQLYQDGDLWAFCEALMSPDEKAAFFGQYE